MERPSIVVATNETVTVGSMVDVAVTVMDAESSSSETLPVA